VDRLASKGIKETRLGMKPVVLLCVWLMLLLLLAIFAHA